VIHTTYNTGTSTYTIYNSNTTTYTT